MEKVGVTLPLGLRKMTEAIFHDTSIQVTVYTLVNADRGNVISKKKDNRKAILTEGEGAT
jgi:hypothetical protein